MIERERRGLVSTFTSIATASIAALGASLCCLGPFVLMALGFGAAAGAVSAFFAPLRPYLLAVAFGIVGWRLFVVYRGSAESRTCDLDSRSAGAPDRGSEKAIAWGALGLVAFFAVSPFLLSSAPKLDRSPDPITSGSSNGGRGDVCLRIDGMSCSSCAGHVEQALRSLAGVRTARVSFEKSEACIDLNDPGAISVTQLINAVSAVGYHAEQLTLSFRFSHGHDCRA